MNKYEFLGRLRERLSGLPQKDIDASLDYYAELIADKIEDGASEEEAVAAMGSIDEIVSQILEDTSLQKLVKEKVRPKRPLRAWEIVLIVLGAPVWVPLLIAFAVIIIALLIAFAAVIISICACAVAVGACVLGFLTAAIVRFTTADLLLGIILIGDALVCAGLSILLFIASSYSLKGSLFLCKKVLLSIKALFIRKEAKA